MLQVLFNFLSTRALNSSPEAYLGLGIVWATLLVAGIMSILSRHWGWGVKVAWLIAIMVPIAGLAAYCVFSLFIADYSFLKMFGVGTRKSTYLKIRTAKQ
ncbi:MAG: hypothetical protein JNJ83_05850 [Verrucomicrobiaceae bacterium]|nr:hypothetical protein [Verrucomicrobiaceae bacterium]